MKRYKILYFAAIMSFSCAHIALAQKTQTTQCSAQDLHEIKKFDRKAKNKLEELQALQKQAPHIRQPKAAKKFTKESHKIRKFYQSEKFKTMAIRYKRCGQNIPRPRETLPFWIPKEGDRQFNLL